MHTIRSSLPKLLQRLGRVHNVRVKQVRHDAFMVNGHYVHFNQYIHQSEIFFKDPKHTFVSHFKNKQIIGCVDAPYQFIHDNSICIVPSYYVPLVYTIDDIKVSGHVQNLFIDELFKGYRSNKQTHV